MSSAIAVLGGGSFGTVIANMAAGNGCRVNLWLRDDALVEEINARHENPAYHPGYTLNDRVVATTSLQYALSGVEAVYVSIPSKVFRQVIRDIKPFLADSVTLVSTTKGIEAETFCLMSQIIEDELPANPVAVISGPNLARELIQHQITASVVASKKTESANLVQQHLASHYFRLYVSNDIYGVELGGVLKNIYAIMAGMASAMALGQNTLSMLMTRSLAEMSRFAVSMGANPLTFLGLAGVGDLFVTCTSPLSRNFRIGHALGKGLTLEQAVEEVGQVAEGVNTLKLVKQKADQLGVKMPLANSLFNILFNGSSVGAEIKSLMERESANDVEFLFAPEPLSC